MRHGGSTTARALRGQRVLLHEIRADSGNAVDSTRTDASGNYRLRSARADSTAEYYVVTEFQDVEYFSDAVRLLPTTPRVQVPPITVYDTTSSGPPMQIERRLITFFRASDEQSGNVVLDIVTVMNPGTRTRIATDSLHPVWALALPDGARDWQVTAGNLVPQAIGLRGDTVQIFAPIWPGAPLRLGQRYALVGPTVRFTLRQAVKELVVLVEDTVAKVSSAALRYAGMRESEGRRFAAYQGASVGPSEEIQLTFSRRRLTPARLLPYIVGVLGLVFALALRYALRRRRITAPAQTRGRS